MNWILLALLAASVGGGPTTTVGQADMAEVNHVYNDGNYSFTQLLGWDWSPDDSRFDCQGWRIIDRYWFTRRGITATTGRSFETLILHAKITRETHTDYDPEIRNKRLFPSKYRRRLWTE